MLRYLVLVGVAFLSVELRHSVHSADPSGHLKNCGTAKNFTLSWKPKELVSRETASVELGFISPYDWSGGLLSAVVYLKDVPDTPIFKFGQDINCDALKKYGLTVGCPIKSGRFVQLKYEGKLPALPSDGYLVKLQLFNSGKQMVICATGEVDIKG